MRALILKRSANPRLTDGCSFDLFTIGNGDSSGKARIEVDKVMAVSHLPVVGALFVVRSTARQHQVAILAADVEDGSRRR